MVLRIIYRLLEPLAVRMTGVDPNRLTLLALILGLAAGLSFFLTRFHDRLFLVGAVLVALSGLLDALDGLVARHHGLATARGDFFDHLADRLVDAAILLGLSFAVRTGPSLGLLATVAILLHSQAGTQLAASFGRRFRSGAGKAELYFGLTAFALWRGVSGTDSLVFLGRAWETTDLLFLAVIGLTLPAYVQRVRLGLGAGPVGMEED